MIPSLPSAIGNYEGFDDLGRDVTYKGKIWTLRAITYVGDVLLESKDPVPVKEVTSYKNLSFHQYKYLVSITWYVWVADHKKFPQTKGGIVEASCEKEALRKFIGQTTSHEVVASFVEKID